ncbi:MAG TPA: tetraacyldisaccharide 4'-kinase, partial [Candidatus Krumholzibacteria bacterium]|nr:tetraacyldisaccharide 4'-kinase [Candidatus Krumholzibacteria bacterium]
MPPSDAVARVHAGVPALEPLAWLYGAGLALSRALGARRREPGPDNARVVAIGNLEAGGSGKTPLAMHLLAAAAAAGRSTAYVSRGYGSPASHGPHVTLVLPRGGFYPDAAAGVRVLERDGRTEIEREAGDEAALVAEYEPRAIVALAAAKQRAVAVAVGLGADLVVVDDAFQSWTLARSVDVVLLDAARPLGSGRLLPAGTLRERPDALRRADVVVFNGARHDADVAAAREYVARWLSPRVTVLGMRRRIEMVGERKPARVFVAVGVARPERVAADLVAAGIEIAGAWSFPDHHAYRQADAVAIAERAYASGAEVVVTTEKDWVKMR